LANIGSLSLPRTETLDPPLVSAVGNIDDLSLDIISCPLVFDAVPIRTLMTCSLWSHAHRWTEELWILFSTTL